MIKVLLALTVLTAVMFGGDYEELEKNCNSKNATACKKMGDICYRKVDFDNLKKDKNSISAFENDKNAILALKYFSKACDEGDASGCHFSGDMYFGGYGTKNDKPMSVKFYIKACDGDDYQGCNRLGMLYGYGMGVKRDMLLSKEYHKKAIETKDKACAEGDNFACVYRFMSL